MARMVRFHECGGPGVLRIDDVPLPDPGRGEVRIAVKSVGLNRAEAMFRSGALSIPHFPAALGYEAAGIVDAIGPDAAGFAIGDRVSTLPGLPMGRYGTYGDRIIYPADMLARIPAGTSFETAAATWMSFLTAYALVASARIKRDDVVLITAASSSVGIAAIQIALAAGAVPIAATRSSAKLEALLSQGARHVIVTGEQALAAELSRLTGGKGADIVFDAVGGDTLPDLVDGLAFNGTIILYGSLGGSVAPLPIHPSMYKEVTIRCYSLRPIMTDPLAKRDAIAFIERGLESGAFDPMLDRSFPLESAAEAHDYMEKGEQIGKITLHVD